MGLFTGVSCAYDTAVYDNQVICFSVDIIKGSNTTKSRDSEQTNFCARYSEKCLKILNITENSEQILKMLKIAENSEQILNITENSEQILNIAENSEQILNITENSEQILNIAENSEHY